MNVVELRQVSKVFAGGVTALSEANLEVRPGELVVLLGPNGSGKTTLLRLIAGLERPTSGQIRIGGRVIDQLAPHQRGVAMLFQSCVLYPHLTVERNIGFGLDGRWNGLLTRFWNGLASRFGMSDNAKSRDARTRVRQTAQLVGVEHLLERYPRQLSGGERQRVALARVFVRHPAVFLLDEPWSNIDVRLRRVLRYELRALRQQFSGGMILVTHDHSEALALGDRIAVLESGRIHQVGTPDEILDNPRTRFVAEFASGLVNVARGRLRLSDGRWLLESDAWGLEWPLEQRYDFAAAERPIWLAFGPGGAVVHAMNAVTRNRPSFQGVVVGIERLAGEFQVLVKANGRSLESDRNMFAVKVSREHGFHSGDCVEVAVDFGSLRCFDQETENRINLGLESAK